jgi:hypothetical protein
LLCAALALAACASDPPKPHRWSPNGPPRNEDWHSPSSSIMKYDANHDGTLTRAELEAGLKAEFNSYDTDHTGCLTSAQVTAINEARVKADAAAASPLIDWKNQGCLDLEEFSATARSLFEQLDINGDGRITPEELHPKRHEQHGAPPPAIDEMGSGSY